MLCVVFFSGINYQMNTLESSPSPNCNALLSHPPDSMRIPPNNKFTNLMQYSNWTHIPTSAQIHPHRHPSCMHACTHARKNR